MCVTVCPEFFEVGSVFYNFLCVFSLKLMYGSFSQGYFIGAGGGAPYWSGEHTLIYRETRPLHGGRKNKI